jgi:hypothetical protein
LLRVSPLILQFRVASLLGAGLLCARLLGTPIAARLCGAGPVGA